ncbi:hypothetical protein BGZ60DRAFT_566904 [Tricladium varicosporioides]|nr:hypothetical protein BGZ60DRAFT_566904 [Hymenoscyphus varicosporioides]
MRFSVVLAAIAAVKEALALPPAHQLNTRQNGSAPCAVVSMSAAAALATSSARPVIDAQLAFDCLNSVNLRANEANQLVDAVRPYVEWQSDLAYLKAPPSNYPFPPADILGTLDAVKANVTTATYKNEYQFQAALFQTFNQAHDGHFAFFPDLLTKAFSFRRQVALVSVSNDGIEIPKIYVLNDTLASVNNTSFRPSAVLKINDIEASRFIQDISDPSTPFQDRDAGYNAMFFSKAGLGGLGSTGFFQAGGPLSFTWPGPTTTLTFENGTTTTFKNQALVRSSFNGVTDGDTFYRKFCTGPTPTASPVPTSSSIPTFTPLPTSTSRPRATAVPGYPAPVIVSSDAVISGYYLTDPGVQDVAVLSVLDFSPQSPAEFQAVAQKFISGAKAAGKQKLVVDLSINGGGFLFLGYDLFRQLFPGIQQDGFSRFRENPAFLKMAQVFSDSIPSNFSKASSPDELIQNFENFYNFRFELDITNSSFQSYNGKFLGPRDKGDGFTSLIRLDLSDPLITSNTTYGIGIDITGYGTRKNFVQPFAPENIILLYDGFCASTCTVFSEFMRLQANVKSVAFGGRPSNTPIQGIGGVKGAQSYGMELIYGDAQRALQIQKNMSQAPAPELLALSDLPLNRSIVAGVNLRDNILPVNLGDGVPAQFVVENSDCRLFWTPQMINDVRAVWNAAAKAAWNNAPCVAGGFPKTNSNASVQAAANDLGLKSSDKGGAKTEVVTSDVVLTPDAGWERRHGTKVVY